MAGIVAASRKRKENYDYLGVAIATALMPPLWYSWLRTCHRSVQLFFSDFYLSLLIHSLLPGHFYCGSLFAFSGKRNCGSGERRVQRRNITIFRYWWLVPSVYMALNVVGETRLIRKQLSTCKPYKMRWCSRMEPECASRVWWKKKAIHISLVGMLCQESQIRRLENRLALNLTWKYCFENKTDLRSLDLGAQAGAISKLLWEKRWRKGLWKKLRISSTELELKNSTTLRVNEKA